MFGLLRALFAKYVGWEPNIKLRDGMEKTYRWIFDEIKAGRTSLKG
jgi:GDP-D-mannose 3',5'-epimerase